MTQDKDQELKDCIEVARNMRNCIKGGEEYIEQMCKKNTRTMTQEQYERAAVMQSEIAKLKWVSSRLKKYATSVRLITEGVADFLELKDEGLLNCMEDYLKRRIAELEKEFEEI